MLFPKNSGWSKAEGQAEAYTVYDANALSRWQGLIPGKSGSHQRGCYTSWPSAKKYYTWKHNCIIRKSAEKRNRWIRSFQITL